MTYRVFFKSPQPQTILYAKGPVHMSRQVVIGQDFSLFLRINNNNKILLAIASSSLAAATLDLQTFTSTGTTISTVPYAAAHSNLLYDSSSACLSSLIGFNKTPSS